MGKGFSYTEVMALVSAQLDKIDRRLEKGGSKMDELEHRVTRLEVDRMSNLRWLAWAGGVVVFALQIYNTIK